ncbi:MAG TPA: alpha/beta hydrolase-fold protein [Bacteroidota bacterium]|nr:alpha/beta hydrolase-fold protein [Bacteroidota bacterium]
MKKLLALGVALLFATFLPQGVRAQGNQITIGETAVLHSDVLREDRQILICMPQGYRHSDMRYPVIYLLDGDAHFLHVTGIADFLSRQTLMPQVIVVGIPNTDRTRDLTPATSDTGSDVKNAGGADRFLKFLGGELEPYIEAHFRTEPYKILIGHSLGGLFAVHAMLKEPGSFNASLALSPSLWWNKQSEVAAAEEFVKSHKRFRNFLYLTLGNEGDQMRNPIERLTTLLQSNPIDGFRWKYTPMPLETHGTIVHRSVYDGLEYLFSVYASAANSRDSSVASLKHRFSDISDYYGYRIEPPEQVVNQLGYALLQRKQIDDAIEMFRYNVENHPGSANVYDSLGDGYEASGDLEAARENCERACARGKETEDPNEALYLKHLQAVNAKLSPAHQ